MPRRNRNDLPLSQREVPDLIRDKIREPFGVLLGSPAEVANLLTAVDVADVTCFQFDLHQAERVEQLAMEVGVRPTIVTEPDVWDMPAKFKTLVYIPARSGERELKIDMVEQAFHVLEPGGTFIVWSPYESDQFFPTLIKKIFGKTHVRHDKPVGRGSRKRGGGDSVLWAQRDGERKQRRHEMTYQARIAGGPSCRFVSRPGVFSYGKLDDGSRALAEVMEIESGSRVIDIGCGCGPVGVFASQQAGPEGHITFVDSNVRAVALAEFNARANGVEQFDAIRSHRIEGRGLVENSYDVALANPPYYANSTIAHLFIARAKALLRPNGRFYLVTRQPEEIAGLIQIAFGQIEGYERRGYTILVA